MVIAKSIFNIKYANNLFLSLLFFILWEGLLESDLVKGKTWARTLVADL